MRLSKKACLEDARKYKTAFSWKSASPEMFDYMDDRDLLDSLFKTGIFKNRPKGYWTFERCKREAHRYERMIDWQACGTSFSIAMKNGWYQDITKDMDIKGRRRVITPCTKEECIEDSRKYKGLNAWRSKSEHMFQFMVENDYMGEIYDQGIFKTTHKGYWTLDKCKKEALKYSYRQEWYRNQSGSFSAAYKNGWLDKCCKHMMSGPEILSKINTIWTKEKCLKEAKKYNKITDWLNGSKSSYGAAKKLGILKDCSAHMEVFIGKWTKEACIKESKKYNKKFDWQKSSGSYAAALKKGWVEECSKHMRHFRTLEDCKLDAKKYKTKRQWDLNSGFCKTAREKGWLDECCRHMLNSYKADLREKRAVDRLIKLIKKNVTKKVEREVFLVRGYPDLTLTVNNKIVIVEVKHDLSSWNMNEVRKQLRKYKTDGKSIYKNMFHGCYLASPKGKFGYNFKSIIEVLKGIK